MFANSFTFINSEVGLVGKAIILMNWPPVNLQKGYDSCIGW